MIGVEDFPFFFCLIVLFLSLMSPAGTAEAQTNSPGSSRLEFTVHSWTTKQGLPENTVTSLLQTRDGYLWVGTPDGLACFDGVQFRRYGVQDGLPHVGILSLLEDRHGTLWVATENGLAYCNENRNPVPRFKTELSGGLVSGMAEDEKGLVWIASQKGLFEWADGHLTRMDRTLDLPGQRLIRIGADRSGGIWIWGTSEKLFRIAAGKAVEVPVDFPLPKAKAIEAMLDDTQGRFWVGTGNGYLICRENGTWKKWGPKQGIPYDYVSSLAETPDGRVWAGSYGGGLLSLQNNLFMPTPKNQGPADAFIRALLADAEGNLWIGTSSEGLYCLRHKELFVWDASTGLSNEVVHAIAETADGSLRVATEGGLYRLEDGVFRKVVTRTKADIYPWGRSVLATHDGNLWWAADENLFNWETVRQPAFTNLNLPPQTKTNCLVYSLFEDRAGKVWVGTSTGLWVKGTTDFASVKGLPSGVSVHTLTQAPDGSVCAGTDTGLFILSPAGIQHYTTREGLESDAIRALHFDSDGVLWIGTRSGGLSRLKEGHIFTYTMHEGLTSDKIVQILEDDNGALWLGTSRGISRVKKRDLDDIAAGRIDSIFPLNLGVEDGMLAEECTGSYSPNAVKGRDGRLYFSTLKGVVALDPKRFAGRATPPLVVIEDTLVGGRTLSNLYAASLLPTYPAAGRPDPPELILSPDQNNLEFRYTGLHSTAPEDIQFRYQMIGLDPDWIDAGTRRFANYNQIPPGHYQFQVRALDRDGNWTSSPAVVGLYLRPYFFQTWWFQTCLLAAGAIALAWFVRQVVRQRLQRRLRALELQQAFENERRRIARDLHDELGARLTAITHLGELAMRSNLPREEVKPQLEIILQRIRQLMNTTDEVVWAINPKNDSLPNIVAYLGDYAERFLAPTGIGWRLDLDPDFPALSVPAQSRHNLLLAAKETLTNAVKHSGATIIRMAIHAVNSRLEVIITDDGRGFDVATLRTGSNGLSNIKSRMELVKGRAQIVSETAKGTTVTLILPLDTVPKEM